MKTRNRLLAILLAMVMIAGMMPMMEARPYAKGESPEIVASDDFAKDAPITTVRLDASKFTTEYATLVSENNYYEWGSDDKTSYGVWTSEVTVPKAETDGRIITLPSFSITLRDAVIMRDDTRKALKVTFDDIKVFTKSGMNEYRDCFQIVSLPSGRGINGINISPASFEKKHFGLRVKVTYQVVGAAADDTLLLFATGINAWRGQYNFELIRYAEENYNYSESIQFLSGIDSESDIYIADAPTFNTSPADTADENAYNVRFIGNGAAAVSDKSSGLATAVSATGASANAWSSAGNALSPLDMFSLSPIKIAKEHTSSSGEGGKIELWTDGNTHTTDQTARKLPGGALTTPYTYAVPYGKEVTYRMTPEKCHVIDKLYVNGSEVDIEDDPNLSTNYNASGKPEYYEYHFGDDTVNDAQEIAVTWKAQHSMTAVERVDPTCTKDGREAYWMCTNCGELFLDEEGKNSIAEPQVIPATGHTEAIDEAVAPTCTETGLTAGKHCSVCNEVLEAQEEVAATGHTEVIDEAVPPTCTETGLTEGKHCSVCNEVLEAQEEVAATGHTEVIDEAVPPTCTETGLTEGKHCSVCNEVLEAQEEVAATDHKYGEWKAIDDKQHRRACEHDDTHVETEDHIWDDGEVTLQPTIEKEGIKTYTCEVCKGEKTESIAKLIPPTYEVKDSFGNAIETLVWQKQSEKPLDFTIYRSEDDNLTYEKFDSLEIDGNVVNSEHYIAGAGSLEMSIKPEYLEMLSVGDHSVKVNFRDGSAAVKLTVLAASAQPTPAPAPEPSEEPAPPKTGDGSDPALWSSLVFLSVAAMVALLLYARKRKIKE